MELAAFVFGSQLDAGDQLDAPPAASGRAMARAETVSWSVIARAASPTRAAATTTSQGEQTPSEWVVCTCRSAAPGMADGGKTLRRRRL